MNRRVSIELSMKDRSNNQCRMESRVNMQYLCDEDATKLEESALQSTSSAPRSPRVLVRVVAKYVPKCLEYHNSICACYSGLKG